jgi:hypothetical protein
LMAARKPKTKAPAPKKKATVHALASSVPDEFVGCRTISHSWRYNDVKMDRKNYVQSLVCIHCGTLRYKVYSPTGGNLGSSYKYPPGYLIKGSLSPAEKGRLNILSLKQHMKEN